MRLDLTGQRYGRLTVVKPAINANGHTRWKCICDCGKECVVTTSHLRNGSTKSCGCYQDEARRNREDQYFSKDVRNRRLYSIWYAMLRRCTDKHYSFFHRYGGRGISVCDSWKDYEVFAMWAFANGYADNLTIDRINNDGNYEPSNCRWIPENEQHSNTSRNRYETINGVRKTMTQWANEYGINPNTLSSRLRNGMNIVDALTMKPFSHMRRK